MPVASAKQAEQESTGKKKNRLYKCKDAEYVNLVDMDHFGKELEQYF